MSARKYWIRHSDGKQQRGIDFYAASDRAAREMARREMVAYEGPWQLEAQDKGSEKIRIVVKHLGKVTAEDDNPLNLPF